MIAGPAPNFTRDEGGNMNTKWLATKSSGRFKEQHTSRHVISSKLNTVVVVRVAGVGDHFFVRFNHFQINGQGFPTRSDGAGAFPSSGILDLVPGRHDGDPLAIRLDLVHLDGRGDVWTMST